MSKFLPANVPVAEPLGYAVATDRRRQRQLREAANTGVSIKQKSKVAATIAGTSVGGTLHINEITQKHRSIFGVNTCFKCEARVVHRY